jgi:hypothetical protein
MAEDKPEQRKPISGMKPIVTGKTQSIAGEAEKQHQSSETSNGKCWRAEESKESNPGSGENSFAGHIREIVPEMTFVTKSRRQRRRFIPRISEVCSSASIRPDARSRLPE